MLTEADFWRFWHKVPIGEGCWEREGARHGKGYGHFRLGKRVEKAHRIAWELTYGSIPPGLQVLHRCDNPPCCRPDHLFLGTNAENNADMISKGRGAFQKVTHCPQGHPYDEANTYVYKTRTGMGRNCRRCQRAANERYAAKRSAHRRVVTC